MSSTRSRGSRDVGPPVVGVFAGLATLDVVSRVARVPRPDEKVTAQSQEVAAGGPAANAAVTFAALGGSATLVTALGRGPLARLVVEDLRRWGVEVLDVAADTDLAVPVSSVMVDVGTGERAVVGGETVVADLAEPAGGEVERLTETAHVLLVDGHHPQIGVALARAAGDLPVVLDAGRWRPSMADLVPLADDVVASAVFRVPGTGTAEETAAALVGADVPVVVTTAGAGPVRWRTSDRAGEVPVARVTVLDTLGAGDAFHGAYAWAMASGADIEGRVALAACVATHRTTVAGARRWLDGIPRSTLPTPL